MKRFKIAPILSTTIVVAFLVPQIASAAWWNPLSWFEGWSFLNGGNNTQTQVLELSVDEPEVEPTPPAPTVTAPVVTQEEKPVMPGISNVVLPQQTLSTPQTILDVCMNIEGVQTVPPAGFYSTSNICTLIEVKDVCPNIAGTQATIPSGRFLYRNTGECLTETEISEAEAEADRRTAEQKVIQEEEQNATALKVGEISCTSSGYLLPFSVEGKWDGALVQVRITDENGGIAKKGFDVDKRAIDAGFPIGKTGVVYDSYGGRRNIKLEAGLRGTYEIRIYSGLPVYRAIGGSVVIPQHYASDFVAEKSGTFILPSC